MDELIHSPRQNRILAALPVDDYVRLVDDLKLVSLHLGQVLYEPGNVLEYVYFPVNCIVSQVFTTENGASSELAMTGKDGLVGVSLALGSETATYKTVVQSEGVAYRLQAQVMCWEMAQMGSLQRQVLVYAQAMMTQMAQSVVCNRHHMVDQQLCRWLLLSLDQLSGNQIDMTQELIASMLGVRREAVTEAAGKLQTAGLIQYSRGHITVIDRPGLEARVCECYRVVKAEYQRLFQLMPVSPLKIQLRANPHNLRRRAEARLRQSPPAEGDSLDNGKRLLHELYVHQIELEIHNEELQRSYDEIDALSKKYADLYDFAPVAYFTLDAQGVIRQLNLAAAILLNIRRSQIGRYRFAAFLNPDCVATFNQFQEEVLNGKRKSHCDLALLATSHRPEVAVRIDAVPNEDGRELQMVLIDVSIEKEAERLGLVIHRRRVGDVPCLG